MNTRMIWAHLGLFAAAAFYAGNFTIAKLVMPSYIQPFGFILLRGLAATFLFWLTAFFWVRESVEKTDIQRLILCGLTGVTINQLFFFKGLSLTTPIHGALIMLTTPILVFCLAAFILRERMTWLKISGICLGLVGAVLLVLQNGGSTFNASNPILGDIYVGINAISYAIYLILVKPLMRKYQAITVLKWTFGFGLLGILPFGWAELSLVQWETFYTTTWISVIYVLICVTFLTYLFNSLALSVVNPSVVGAYIYLQPLLTAIIAVFTQQDHLSETMLLSGVLIFGGVYLVSREK